MMNNARPISRSRRRLMHEMHGVALLEALIAILLFSIGILGMASLQAKAVKLGADAEDRTSAAMLADEAVGLMWMNQTTTLSAGVVAAWRDRVEGVSSPLAGATASISAPDAAGAVTITIQWTPASRAGAGGSTKTAQYFTKVSMP